MTSRSKLVFADDEMKASDRIAVGISDTFMYRVNRLDRLIRTLLAKLQSFGLINLVKFVGNKEHCSGNCKGR